MLAILIYLLCVGMHIYVGCVGGEDNMHATIHLCRTEENMQELVLFFCHVGARFY